MKIKQISVFIGNKKGRLAMVTETLSKAGIDIRALSLADTTDFGMLRMIVDDPDKCAAVLKKHDFMVQETEVIAVEVDDTPGGLNRILKIFDKDDINIEYVYAMVEKRKNAAVVIFRVEDQQRAVEVLRKNGIALVDSDSLKR